MIAPTNVISVSLTSGTYITDGILVPSSNVLAFATSNDIIKIYNASTGSFLRDITDHNGQITDMAQFGVPNQTSVLISSQRDTGILITDLRAPDSKPQYLTELQGSKLECFGISVSPSGNQFALSAGTDIHVLDPRMNFRSLRHIPDMHTDVITKLRFVSENIIVSGGEDMMLNVVDVSAKSEGDLLVSSISWGEAPNRLNVIGNRFMTATGTMEGSIVQPIPQDVDFNTNLQNADWPLELNISRPPLGSYLVDFIQMPFSDNSGGNNNNGELELGAIVGERPGAENCLDQDNEMEYDKQTGNFVYPGDRMNTNNDNDNKPQGLSIMRVSPKGIQPSQRIQLVPTHRDDVRCVIPLPGGEQGKLVTAGEDGTICFWDLNRAGQQAPLNAGQQRKPQRMMRNNSGNQQQDDDDNDEDNNNNNQEHSQESSTGNSSSSAGSGKEQRQRGAKSKEHQQNMRGGRGGGGGFRGGNRGGR